MLKTNALMSMWVAVCLLLTGCGSDSPEPTSSNPPISSERANVLSGIAQKGGFLTGSTVTTWQLNEQGQRTDQSSSSEILEDSGKYNITPSWSGWTEIQVKGRYFDEFSGKESTQEIQLTSIAELVTESTSKNVNLFTHLQAKRTRSLALAGQSMTAAVQAALVETQNLIGLGTANPSDLDITDGIGINAKNNAMLLLFSGAFLADGGDTSTLDRMAEDFADDGQVNGNAKADFDGIGNRASNSELMDQLTENLKSQGFQDSPDSNDLGEVSPQWVNKAPVAQAGEDQTVKEGVEVTIDANGSSDPDGTISRFFWTQLSGETILIANTSSEKTTFKAPSVTNAEGTNNVVLQLTVTDQQEAIHTDTVQIKVEAVNDAPTASSQILSMDEDTQLPIVLTGDDIDKDTISFIVVTEPGKGKLSGSAPTITYTPDANFSGTDSFTFKVNDGTADSALATISLTIKDNDSDNDDVLDGSDNCPAITNTDQTNTDADNQGDACDDDDDNDGVVDIKDEKPLDKTAAATMESAHRLLLQTTFGPTLSEINRVEKIGVDAWVEEELSKPSAYDSAGGEYKTHVERLVEISQIAEPDTDWFGTSVFNQSVADHNSDDYHMAVWWENAIGLHPIHIKQGSDQLRQRVAFALSQLLVVSNSESPLDRRGEALAYYYDILTEQALGNYRDLLDQVAKSPAMGIYLSHQGNRKAIPTAGTRPDENFAREIMQLFTIGLYQLNTDGSADLDGNPNTPDIYNDPKDLVPSYDQVDIEELAKVMTGWDLADNTRYGWTGTNQGNYMLPMEFTPEEHEDEVALNGDGSVTVLGNTFKLNSGDGSGMKAALDTLFNHQNVAPLVSKHLIMRLVTSNPTPEYVARVAGVFNNNGSNTRGDLKSVVRAILIDDEARGESFKTDRFFGKAKEPILAFSHLLRAFGAVPMDGWIGIDKTTVVNGIYWLRAPEQSFAQGPLRAHSVFNFYSADFVPSDTDFAMNKKVSPEMQIQTDQILVEYSNKVFLLSRDYEKNYRNEVYKTYTNHNADIADLAEYAASRSFWSSTMPIINFDRELALFEQALEGDSNGDFSDMENTESKQVAVKALISHLNMLLLGGTMSLEYEAAMEHYLLDASGLSTTNNFVEAFNIIQNAVRLIATSSSYMIQK